MDKELSVRALGLIAERFRVLSEPVRLRIVHRLNDGELSVSELTNALELSQPNVSRHLKILQDAGIVRRDPRGNAVYYSIADESIFKLCDVVCSSLSERIREQAGVFALA